MTEKKCDHSGEKKRAITKSGVYIVCAECGARLEKLENGVLIEKVVVPDVLDKS